MMKDRIYLYMLGLFLLLCSVQALQAQQVAVKTNLPLWGTVTPNLAAEAGVAPRWTLDFSAAANPFTFDNNRKWKHYLLQGEARYWLCERFYGHFLGLHVGGGEFNASRISVPWLHLHSGYRYEGWSAGAGLSYGYTWVLGGRWNLEATIGVGLLHLDYKQFECPRCGEQLGREKKNYIAPTRAAINLIYMLK